MVYYLYADETLVLNTVINYFLFLSSLRLSHLPIRRRRALFAAFLASLYSLGALFPSLSFFYIFPCKLLSALILSFVAAGKKERIVLVWALFLSLSLLFGGAVTSLTFLLHAATPLSFSGTVFVAASLRTAAALSAAVYYFVALFFRKLLPQKAHEILQIRVVSGSRHITLPLLLDTGAGVYDPANGLAVPIVSKEAVRPLFSESDYFLLSSLPPPDAVLALGKNRVRFGLLPVTTAAESTMLLTFRADELISGGQSARGALVAIASREFSPDSDFQGIIAPQ